MNEYLAKLHNLESAAEAPGPEKRIVEAPTKPDKTSSVSFVGDPSMGFSEVEARAGEIAAAPDMRNVISWSREKHYHSDRQNRQNPVVASFRCAHCGRPGGTDCGYDGVIVRLHPQCRRPWTAAYDRDHPLQCD